MAHVLSPAIWLIVLIVGLPQLSETVYTPSLPDIARSLQASESMVEYTLTIYLFGFALGTLFWGKASDRLGRKPCVIMGLVIFTVGCVGCYFSGHIEILMASRLIQAFGGSIGSVLGQAICRDAFHGPALGKVYSSTGSALAVFPAIGPVIGGMVAECFGWPSIFLFLMGFAILLMVLVMAKLPETHMPDHRKAVPIWDVAFSLLTDKKVMGFGLIVAACNGILFSYFAEAPFYLIKSLGISPSEYGFSFIAIAISTMAGGITSKKLHNHHTSKTIMGYGLVVILLSATISSSLAVFHSCVFGMPDPVMIGTTILAQMGMSFGICMATSNALALALGDYKHCIGTASSLFGFFYYSLISAFTLGMGVLHDGTLLPMPLYFFGIAVFMLMVQKAMVR